MKLSRIKYKLRYASPVHGIIKWLQGKRFFPYLYKLLYVLRLEDFSRLSRKPQTLQKSRDYFTQNQSKINLILEKLADEESKRVFTNQLLFRQYAAPLPLGTPYNAYFPKDIIHLSRQEVFVDCGAFTGDSVLRFQKASRNKYKAIAAFETNPQSFEKLKSRRAKNCTYFNYGVWNKKDVLLFASCAKETDKLLCTSVERIEQKESPCFRVPVRAIDDTAACTNMTFLKMDIEGAELKALQGAEKTIRHNLPTLAISIYHSDQDLLEIPLWILSLNLNYKYYVRHHGVAFAEVVFYAVKNQASATDSSL